MRISWKSTLITTGIIISVFLTSIASAQDDCPPYEALIGPDGRVIAEAVPPGCEVPEPPDGFKIPAEFCPVYEVLPIGPDGRVIAEAVPPGCDIPDPPDDFFPREGLINEEVGEEIDGPPAGVDVVLSNDLPIDFFQEGVLPEELPEFVETNEEGQLFIDPLFIDPKTGKAFADPNGATLEQLGADIDELGAEDLKELDDSVITKLNQEQLGSLSLEAVSGFSDVQIEKLAPGALAGFTEQQLSALTPSALAKLSGSQVLGLSDTAVKGLNEKQIDALDALSFAGFRANQLAELSPEAVAGIKPEQFANLRNEALSGLKAEQISAITPETFTALEKQQLERLAANALAGLTAEQLTVISTNTIEGINQKQLQSLSKEALEGLTANQFLALDKSALGGLTSANFSGLQPEILSAMTEVDLDRLDPSDVAENFSNFVTNLNEVSISPEKVAKLLPDGWNIDSTGELEAPVGAKLTFAALRKTASTDIDGIYSALPDLNTNLSLGGKGGGDTVIGGMNKALVEVGLTGVNFTQEQDGTLNVSIAGDNIPAASFIPDTSSIVQAPKGTAPGLEINEDTGGYVVTTDKGYQIPLLPSLINPVEVNALLPNSEISTGPSGQLLISNVEGEDGISSTIGAIAVPLLGTSNLSAGVYRSGVGSSESVTIVLEDGTSQKLNPAIYDQDAFKSAAKRIGIKDINFRLDGTVSLSFQGEVIKIKPLFSVEKESDDRQQASRLRLIDGRLFIISSNGDMQEFLIVS
jgi:hypothetical protein